MRQRGNALLHATANWLVLIYALWKNNQAFDINYKNQNTKEQEQVLPLGTAVAVIGNA
jgi:hypothetical protein